MNEQYPYNNTSVVDLPNEVWNDVPQLIGYYKVSNLGRVRRLARQDADKRGGIRTKSEMILSPIKVRSWNAYMQDYRMYLIVALFGNQKRHNWSLPRLVYYCCIAEFDLTDKNLYVLPKDGDPLNVAAENLFLGTGKDKSALMNAAGRKANPFAVFTPEKRKETQQKINAIKREKGTYQISRYSLSGKLLETYANANDAAKAMNTTAHHLSHAGRKKTTAITACGYLWRKGADREIDITSILEKKFLGASPLVTQQNNIGQYDLKGKLINTHGSIKGAARSLGILHGSIRRAINGYRLTAGGFLWRRGCSKSISVKNLPKDAGLHGPGYPPELLMVSQYDLDGRWIKTYAKAAEATVATGVYDSEIYKVINGKAMTAGGFLWKRGNDLRINVNTLRKHPCFPRSALDKHMKKKRELHRESSLATVD